MSHERIRELLDDVRQLNAEKLEYFRLYQEERARSSGAAMHNNDDVDTMDQLNEALAECDRLRAENAQLRAWLRKAEQERDHARHAYSNAQAMHIPR